MARSATGGLLGLFPRGCMVSLIQRHVEAIKMLLLQLRDVNAPIRCCSMHEEPLCAAAMDGLELNYRLSAANS